MKIVKTKDTDLILGAPADWNEAKDGPCVGLPVIKTEDRFISFWKPGFREAWALMRGRSIMLTVFGNGHPPVSLAVTLKKQQEIS